MNRSMNRTKVVMVVVVLLLAVAPLIFDPESVDIVLKWYVNLLIGTLGTRLFVLPLVYNFSRAIYDARQGRVTVIAPVMQIAEGLMWLVMIMAFGYLLARVFPNDIAWLKQPSVIRWIGFGAVIVFVFTPMGRAQMANDYQRGVRLRYAK